MARSRPTKATEVHRRRILDAAEVVLRRHGASKTNVVDVAKELGQTHASVYRYFASKSELIDALVERWLSAISDPLDPLTRGEAAPGDRLRSWSLSLFHAKVRKVRHEFELFTVYQTITAGAHDVVGRHLATLTDQVEAIIVAGIAAGDFRVTDPRLAALAFLNGSLRFHHPTLLAPPHPIPTEAEADRVIALLLAGLRAGVI